jgi:hypothetical protein
LSQCADALQTLLERQAEGLMNDTQIACLAERLADDINLTQKRNRRARESHQKRRLRELCQLGVKPAALTCCDAELAL